MYNVLNYILFNRLLLYRYFYKYDNKVGSAIKDEAVSLCVEESPLLNRTDKTPFL